MTDQQVKPTREQIEQRAYQIYLERGAQDGLDTADWLAAEKELMEQMKMSAQRSAQPTSTSRTQKRDAAAA